MVSTSTPTWRAADSAATLMVCVNTRTVLAAVLREGSGFGVNVLSQDQEFLSRACARPRVFTQTQVPSFRRAR